jgi:galactokinase
VTGNPPDGVRSLGLSPAAERIALRRARQVAMRFASRIGDPATGTAWWVPGRIEVLGKHTDYGGGRSLLCAVERGFHVLASPRRDATVRIIDASTGVAVPLTLSPDLAPQPGQWTDYPISVLRRVARDFPHARTGMDIVIRSSLPSASGLSSSSALVIATFLPLAKWNQLDQTDAWRSALPSREALAGYLGAVENGRAFGRFAADHGVGTHGGSEDHTAILCCAPGQLAQYRFLPVTHEATVPLPPEWIFAIASSGAHAAKGGGARARYNELSLQLSAILDRWNRDTDRHDASLLDAIGSAPDASTHLEHSLRRTGDTTLLERLLQFRAECDDIIPAVVAALRDGDPAALGPLVDRSQALAESTLRNQIAETVHLARTARASGAVAASAFGAGFGGSVWALVRGNGAEEFIEQWRADYRRAYPERRTRSEFFLSRPGPGARELTTTDPGLEP